MKTDENLGLTTVYVGYFSRLTFEFNLESFGAENIRCGDFQKAAPHKVFIQFQPHFMKLTVIKGQCMLLLFGDVPIFKNVYHFEDVTSATVVTKVTSWHFEILN